MMFKGIYSDLIIKYIQLQRGLGYKLRDREYIFTQFDRLTIERNEEKIGISKDLSDEWCSRRPNETEATQYSRIVVINLFSRHLNDLGYVSYVSQVPKHRYSFSPYVYTLEEISSIFNAADRYTAEKLLNSMYCFLPVFIRLLYCTGLRLSEALTLEDRDINLEEQLLTVRNTKNGTDRIIPISNSLTSVLIEYYNSKNNTQTKFFFEYNGKPSSTRSWISTHFRRILFYAGITYKGKGEGPRLQDLRHTFACHSLEKLEKTGLDIYYSLPILSTYLGHRTLEGTEKYVRLTPQVYSNFMRQQEDICTDIFPEIKKDNEYETY